MHLVYEDNPYNAGANGQTDGGGLQTSQLFVVDNDSGFAVGSIFYESGKYCMYSDYDNKENMFRQYDSFDLMIDHLLDYLEYDGKLKRNMDCNVLQAGQVIVPSSMGKCPCNRIIPIPRIIKGGSYAKVKTNYEVLSGPGYFLRYHHYCCHEPRNETVIIGVTVEFSDLWGNMVLSPQLETKIDLEYYDYNA